MAFPRRERTGAPPRARGSRGALPDEQGYGPDEEILLKPCTVPTPSRRIGRAAWAALCRIAAIPGLQLLYEILRIDFANGLFVPEGLP